ncbi:MAG: ATP-binding protein [Prevotellaceae bacterium]|jgi:predicted AAA+ superfamily ATPase|nr:ATP-binding protein [Prevotellaceae bacterium]
MVKREIYLSQLRELKDVQIIKVIVGVRRCGKSTLLEQCKNELFLEGVPATNIQHYNLEEPENTGFEHWHDFYFHIKNSLSGKGMNYIFFDEIQMLSNFERLLDGLHILKNVDLYVTGSNAYLLSSELATILTGRAITIEMYPFSFLEYLEYQKNGNPSDNDLINYLQIGGFPQALELLNISHSAYESYLKGLYSTILEKDIKPRNAIYNEPTFENLVRYLSDSVGSSVSANSIAGYFRHTKDNIDDKTVNRYISLLNKSYLFYHSNRFDLKGKKMLKTQGKEYIVDTGFRNVLLGRENLSDLGHILENIVYFELLRRRNSVWIGKNASGEIDFVAKDSNGYTHYYQVCLTMREESTRERELSAFMKLKNHHPKTVICLDPEEPTYNGIVQRNATKWLMKPSTINHY